jgi:hypothetical protein
MSNMATMSMLGKSSVTLAAATECALAWATRMLARCTLLSAATLCLQCKAWQQPRFLAPWHLGDASHAVPLGFLVPLHVVGRVNVCAKLASKAPFHFCLLIIAAPVTLGNMLALSLGRVLPRGFRA